MRLFMEHKTDVLPVVERGRIVGEIDRLAIMEALSEIRPEGYMLAIKPAESADELLRRVDAAGLDNLATINRNFEFNALWSRAEIMQGGGKTPQVKIWTPPAEPEPVKATFTHAAVETAAATGVAEEKPASTFTIVRETPKPPVADAPAPRVETRPVAENLHREIERGRLAINTLAALDLPLMACDGAGNEIFHNRAFADIRLRDAMNLKSDDLVHRAKDAITESALKGELDIEKAVKIKAGPRGFDVLCKAIRNFDDPTSRAVGYIFWLVARDAHKLAEAWMPAGEPGTHTLPGPQLYAADAATGDYSGKTLPEILASEEAKAMAWAMREADGNQSDAALLLGIPRQTFNYRYRKLTRGKPSPRKAEPAAKATVDKKK